jgi:hypothetical protein
LPAPGRRPQGSKAGSRKKIFSLLIRCKKNKHSRFAPLLLLSPETIRRMQLERTWGGFYPPFLKGSGGDFRYKPAAEIPPNPAFSKGRFFAILR